MDDAAKYEDYMKEESSEPDLNDQRYSVLAIRPEHCIL